jgi:hypothetical protein
MKSNLKIRSNIYPIDHDMFQKIKNLSATHSPIPEFIKQIRGKSALKKMVEFVHGKANDDNTYKNGLREIGVEEWQIELYWDELDNRCVYANGRHPHGLIAPGIIGCRCNNDKCHLYDKINNKCGA